MLPSDSTHETLHLGNVLPKETWRTIRSELNVLKVPPSEVDFTNDPQFRGQESRVSPSLAKTFRGITLVLARVNHELAKAIIPAPPA